MNFFTSAESLATLLRTAYAVEQKALDTLREQAEFASLEMRPRIMDHIVETQWQLKLLGACLEFQGIDKNFVDKGAHGLVEEVGRLEDLFSIKRFEINLYKKIISAAREAAAPEILQACREILEQERAMAEWLEDRQINKWEPKQAVGY